jgi:ABC-type branched-subunit amino acid transport system substrate-binding protein
MRKHPPASAVVAVVVAAAVLALVGCSGSTQANGSSSRGPSGRNAPINVLAIVAKSGHGHKYGKQELLGLKAAARYYNSKGGINGHKVVVTSLNGNGDPSTATSVAVKELSAHPDKYSMVYPGSEGTVVKALMPVMARHHVLAISINDSGVCADVSKCPHQLTLAASQTVPALAVSKWMKSKGYTKVGILQEQASYTESETPAVVSALDKAGIAHVTVHFPSSAVNLTTEVQQLKSQGVRAVYAEAVGAPSGYALDARAKLNWNAPILFDIAGSSLDLTKLAPASQLSRVYLEVHRCSDTSKTSAGGGLTKMIKLAPKGAIDTLPCNLSGSGWDAVALLNKLVNQSKSTDYQKLTKAAAALSSAPKNPLYIVTRKYAYTASNHENQAATPQDYSILPVGPIKGGQVQQES